MKRTYLEYGLIVVSILCCLTSCRDEMNDMVIINDDPSANAVWHSPEVWSRAQSQQYFLRDHAVGYSYNAISGETYSLDDVRCQVVNRAELDRLADVSNYYLYTVNEEQSVTMEGNVYHSFTQYIQNSHLKAEGEASITLIAGGAAKYECDLFEDGTIDCYIVEAQSKITSGNYRIQADAIMELAKTYPTVLTASFRDAVRQVAEAPLKDYVACVDSFIHTYGTHVVTFAEMGGSMNVLLQFEKKKFNTQEFVETALSAKVLEALWKKKQEGGSSDEEYKFLEDAKCHIDVLGGNVRYLDKLTNINNYRNNMVDYTAFTEWQSSVVFDPDDFQKNTASVIRMEFTPIYNFVSDPAAKQRIRSVIKGSTQDLIDMLGNRNFVNVSFPYNPQNLSYTLGEKTNKSCTTAPVINMIYAGRHVASLCTERVTAIDTVEDVRVVYPVYEGRIQLYNGVCAHGKYVYSVAWNGDKCMITGKAEIENAETVYVTAGVPSFTKYENITYAAAHPLPDLEIDLPFQTDGSYNEKSTAYFVEKENGYFYLPATKGKGPITSIPNWSYDKTEQMMKRDDSYIYIYNPKELKYHD